MPESITLPMSTIKPRAIKISVRISGSKSYFLRKKIGLFFVRAGCWVGAFVGALDIHVESEIKN